MHPELPPETEADALRLADGASYLASRGPDGVAELKRWVAVAKGAPWLNKIQVHGAIANGWTELVQYLLEEPAVRSDANAFDANTGYAPLHFAVVWGRPGIAVLLLSRGADPELRTVGKAENTAFDMARVRLGRLLLPKLDRHDGIEQMREEGRELVRLLEGVYKAGGYAAWAFGELRNRHVQRHSPALIAHALRAEIAVLRELVQRGRAEVDLSLPFACRESPARRSLEGAHFDRPSRTVRCG